MKPKFNAGQTLCYKANKDIICFVLSVLDETYEDVVIHWYNCRVMPGLQKVTLHETELMEVEKHG